MKLWITLLLLALGGWSSTTAAKSICKQEPLACVVYFEARGESEKGRYAVAFITANRLINGKWGSDFKSVVFYKGAYSWTNDKRLSVKVKSKSWITAKRIASEIERLMQNPYLYAFADFTEGRLYFQDKNLKQRRWHQEKIIVGNHALYHERGWKANQKRNVDMVIAYNKRTKSDYQ